MASQLLLDHKPFIELQIEALVEENRIKSRRIDRFVSELESRLKAIKDAQCDKLSSKTLRLPIIGRPNGMNSDYPAHYKFSSPKKLHIVGGYKTTTAIKSRSYVDLAVCLPFKGLEKKDVKNQRYHQKRALYLAQLSQLMNGPVGHGLIEKLEFCYSQGDLTKPVLLITPKDKKLRSLTSFQLFVCLDQSEECPIKASNLVPLRGNVAPKWFFQDYPLSNDMIDLKVIEFVQKDSDIGATPFYNSSVLVDVELLTNSELLAEQLENFASITEALTLAKIWLYQRELHCHFSFIISMFVAYLQTKQIVHQNMSAFQIFRLIVKSLVESDWSDAGLSYYDDSELKIATFKSVFPVVFVSPSGNLNLCYNITTDLYDRLKHEAKLTSVSLLTLDSEAFDVSFLRKVKFYTKFDSFVHVAKFTRKMPIEVDYLKSFMDHGAFTPRVLSEPVLAYVRKGLTDRVLLIQQSFEHHLVDKRWNVKSIPYDPSNDISTETFSIGLLLDSEKSLRIIDVGPPADSEEAEGFRNFWAPKSQLRLQNGVISETVVWHVDSFSQRRAITKYILIHCFKRINMSDIVVHNTTFDNLISLRNVYFSWRDDRVVSQADENISNGGNSSKRKRDKNQAQYQYKPIGVGEEVFQRVMQNYNELNKVLRGVDGLKYLITGLQPVSHHYRASATFPPLPVSLQAKNKSLKRRKGVTLFPENFNQAGKVLYIEPIEVLITLESSGKWPNELDALESAKLDYLIQLGESLKAKEYAIKFSESHLDVLQGQFVFRLRVKCQKEIALMASVLSKQALQRRRLELEIAPKCHASLDQLYRERPAFGQTCRLVKRWISSQLHTDHLNDMTLELIVAHLFLKPYPYTEPSSAACGFKRFLLLMAIHDWQQAPLIVNFDNQLKLDEVNKLKQTLIEPGERDKYPPLVICTPYDKEVSPWTRTKPEGAQLELLVRLCTKAFDFLNKQILLNLDTATECKALFRPNFKTFHLLIKLESQVVQNFFMTFDPPQIFKLMGKESDVKRPSAFSVMPVVGLSIIEQYVHLLRDKLGHLAWFFYDKYGQRVIGVILKPDSERLLAGDLDEFTSDVKKLGAKLVESITVVKKDN